jgi:hypothetical protein
MTGSTSGTTIGRASPTEEVRGTTFRPSYHYSRFRMWDFGSQGMVEMFLKDEMKCLIRVYLDGGIEGVCVVFGGVVYYIISMIISEG